jgi:tetratricopeptide (TPR) repeat protein
MQHGRLSRRADELERRGELEEAVATAARAVRALERALGPTNAEVTRAQADLAERCARHQQWPRAGLLVDQVLHAWIETLPVGAGDLAELALRLAEAYVVVPRDLGAEKVIEVVLGAPEPMLLPRPAVDGQGWGERFVDLGSRLHDVGRDALALRFLQRAGTLLESEGASPDLLHRVWSELAILHGKRKDPAAAEQILRRAILLALRPERPDSSRLVDLHRRLAEACQEQRKFPEMEDAYRRAVAVHDQAFGADDRKVVTLLWPLAGFYRRSGRLPEAENLYRRIYQVTLPQPPLDVVDRLATIYEAEGRWGEAEAMLRHMYDVHEQGRAPDGPSPSEQAPTVARLAICASRLGRQAEGYQLFHHAETLFQTALVRCARDHGPASPEMARLLEIQVLLFRETGRHAQAEEAEARLRVIRGVTLREVR